MDLSFLSKVERNFDKGPDTRLRVVAGSVRIPRAAERAVNFGCNNGALSNGVGEGSTADSLCDTKDAPAKKKIKI